MIEFRAHSQREGSPCHAIVNASLKTSAGFPLRSRTITSRRGAHFDTYLLLETATMPSGALEILKFHAVEAAT